MIPQNVLQQEVTQEEGFYRTAEAEVGAVVAAAVAVAPWQWLGW